MLLLWAGRLCMLLQPCSWHLAFRKTGLARHIAATLSASYLVGLVIQGLVDLLDCAGHWGVHVTGGLQHSNVFRNGLQCGRRAGPSLGSRELQRIGSQPSRAVQLAGYTNFPGCSAEGLST